MSIKLFITGTDTNAGKTHVSIGIIKSFNRLHHKTLGLKPVASGCIKKQGILYSEDALALQAASSISLPYAHINPFAFAPPIAPHIAADEANIPLDIDTLTRQSAHALHYPADLHLIEGVGGWFVPLNKRQTMADFVIKHQFAVIIVVALRLGCLNHALLTVRAIKNTTPLAGWIANCTGPHCQEKDALIETLTHWLPAPCLGIVSYQQAAEEVLDPEVIKRGFHAARSVV